MLAPSLNFSTYLSTCILLASVKLTSLFPNLSNIYFLFSSDFFKTSFLKLSKSIFLTKLLVSTFPELLDIF